ncbi:MAG: ketopantoate reductase family protein [Bacteroidales bacterium]|nr:ketopantoate reductase family protein [Bacteroidales bacterium]
MKIAIIGTGGVGGYFGGRLAKAKADVTFLARGEHLKAMLKNGLSVRSIHGDFEVSNVKATDCIREISQPDLVILAVKAWQLKEVREEIAGILHPDTLILPLQNGVLAVQELEEKIDRKHILGGLCSIFSKLESPGVISHFGVKPRIVFGKQDGTVNASVSALKKLFDQAGIDSILSEDIEAELWKKFIAICVSGLLAVTRTTYGEIREIPETRQMMTDLLNEVYLLSQKAGVKIDAGFVEKSVRFIDTFPYDSSSSLTRDVLQGKPSEIEYQNGTVVRLAERYGMEVPVNRFVYYSILPGELKSRQIKA